MSRFFTRRTVLAGMTATGLAASSPLVFAKTPRNPVFGHGVASGDPDHESVVLWARVMPAPGHTEVRWEIAEDEGFSRVAGRGSVTTDAGRDHTVKIIAGGLVPGQRYFYRFHARDTASPVGRTRTLPQGSLDKLVIAIASCSNYPFGYFNVYDAMAKDEDIDLFLHLGDYIYEYGGPDGWGEDVGTTLGRNHAPAHEIVSLSDYRTRHAQYKSDPGLQAAHGAFPSITIWDDHESTNNPWTGGAQNHQPEFEGRWEPRRSASLQAYFEWMPVRDPLPGQSRFDYWRHYAFGDLASMVTLETRHSARAEQIDYADHLPKLNSPEDGKRFLKEVFGAPGRRMISAEQEVLLERSFKESLDAERPWRLIGNQIPIARTHVPKIDASTLGEAALSPDHPMAEAIAGFIKLGELDLPFYPDTWDGYGWAREQFYDLAARQGVNDLLVLTGDSHAFWANSLYNAQGDAMGLEIGTAGITSPGDFENFSPEVARELDRLVAAHNREVEWTDNVHPGYVRLELGRESARADYVTVSTILQPEYETSILKSLRILKDGRTLRYA